MKALSDNDATYLLRRLGMKSGRGTASGIAALRREAQKLADMSEPTVRMAARLRKHPGPPANGYNDHEQALRAAHLLCSRDFYETMLLRKRFYRNDGSGGAKHRVEVTFNRGVRQTAMQMTFDKLLEKIDAEVMRGRAQGPADTFGSWKEEEVEHYERSWLIRCMHDRCVDTGKRRTTHDLEVIDDDEVEKPVDHPSALNEENPESVFYREAVIRYEDGRILEEQHDVSSDIWNIIDNLPDNQRRVFRCKFNHENGTRRKTNREVANELGMTLDAVVGAYNGGRRAIRNRMREMGYDI